MLLSGFSTAKNTQYRNILINTDILKFRYITGKKLSSGEYLIHVDFDNATIREKHINEDIARSRIEHYLTIFGFDEQATDAAKNYVFSEESDDECECDE